MSSYYNEVECAIKNKHILKRLAKCDEKKRCDAVAMEKSVLNANENFSLLLPFNFFLLHMQSSRYDRLSDGLDDVVVDNTIITQATLEDEEALDPIDNLDDDDIWHEAKLALRPSRPCVAYQPLNDCDSR